MTFDEYQKKAQETDIRPKEIKMICNGFGLIGELDELEEIQKYDSHYALGLSYEDDDIIKEVGDVCWYIASICTELNISLDYAIEVYNENESKGFEVSDMNMAEIFKKVYRDNDGKFTGEYKYKIIFYIGYLLQLYLDQFCDIRIAMKQNIKKLQSRKKRGKIKGSGNNR